MEKIRRKSFRLTGIEGFRSASETEVYSEFPVKDEISSSQDEVNQEQF
jgi:hypothetical protein